MAMERSVLGALVTTMAHVLCFSGAAIATEKVATVIVVGAGMSGISAAKTLSDAGIKDILVLEATNRIGGRMHKTNFAGISVEMGANWVEGVGGSEMINPIWTMAKNVLHLKTFYSDFDNLSSNTYKQMGGLFEESMVQKEFDLADKLFDDSENISTSLSAHGEDDISILVSQRLQNQLRTTLRAPFGC